LVLAVVFGLFAVPGFAVTAETTGANWGINWSEILQGVIAVLIATVVPILAVQLVALAGVLASWFAAKKEESWYLKAGGIVADAVFATAQTLGDEIKEAAKDGKFTQEEKDRLFQHAKDAAMKNLGVIPGKILPTLESWIRTKIESELAKLKIFQKAGPASLPPAGVQAVAPSRVI
jgi:hypothetical protein